MIAGHTPTNMSLRPQRLTYLSVYIHDVLSLDQVGFHAAGNRERYSHEYELEGRSIRTVRSSYDPEEWQKGIIKTISVEVVEEENFDVSRGADVPRGADVSRTSTISLEQDWETVLRAGPARP